MKKLPREFFERSTLKVAMDLLGCVLVSNVGGVKTGGVIVETEAYIGENDPACHACRGMTKRNEIMYGPAGFLYVYFTYGNHFMMNVVTEKIGFPSAVLIRGMEPLFGKRKMRARRGTFDDRNISSGPGKLTKALGITKEHNGADLTGNKIYLAGPSNVQYEICASPRVGIGQGGSEKLWRFFVSGNPHVSRGARYNKENTYSLKKAGEIRFTLPES